DDGRPGAVGEFGDPPHHLRSVHSWHAHVRDDASGRGLRQMGEKVGAAGEAARLQALAAEENDERVADSGVVLDDEDGARCAHCGLPSSGRRMENAAPPRRLRPTSIAPPWPSTMLRVTDRPSPIPVALVLVIGWNTRSRCSSGTPGPLSSTART